MPSETRANRLIHETSPYLLQHAHNPVDWYPWGEEAFARARAENRPIFLSIGYSSCHWCHVMERESFEDEETARALNADFVAIKVDREEMPDVDSLYMTALHMIGGQGGWPLSMFLTPDRKPFFGGTYFPPQSLYGRPSFRDVLRHVTGIWKAQRPKIDAVSERIARALRGEPDVEGGEGEAGAEAAALGAGADLSAAAGEPPDAEAIRDAYETLARSFDPAYGGFGGAPKFPHAMDLAVLLIHHHATGERRALEMVETTLDGMAKGGIRDHLGGGFHRYSTDAEWLVPHFEKMLYDNALLARIYVEAYQATGQARHAEVARETLDYVLREMTSPEGGFYSATDADSEGEEGKFFVWKPEEVEALLGREKARVFCFVYGVSAGGNFEGGSSILHLEHTPADAAGAFSLTPEAVEATLREGRAILQRERDRRVPPFRDEKVLAGWNGLMISALARAAVALGEPRYREAAERAARLIVEKMTPGGALHRTWKDGRARFPASLEDHSYVIEALLDLHEATFDPAHLERARQLADRMIDGFWDARENGFFNAPAGQTDLIARRKDPTDGATPSASGVAALDLLRLAVLTGEKKYREKASLLLGGLAGLIIRVPQAFASTLLAVDFLRNGATEIAVLVDPADPQAAGLLRAIGRRRVPRRVLTGAPRRPAPDLERKIPLLAGKEPRGGRPTVFICRDYACEAPIDRLDSLEARLEEISRPRAPAAR